jgi:hypothetical protein
MKHAIPVLLIMCLLASALASSAHAMGNGTASALPPTPEDKIRM